MAGTHCRSVALKLAERFDLNCVTARSCFPVQAFDTSVLLRDEFRKHLNKDVDDAVDAALSSEISKLTDDFVVCSYNSLRLVPNAIHILLVSDIQAFAQNAKLKLYRDADRQKACKNAFNPNYYDIIVNTTVSIVEEVVDCIAMALSSGKYGLYVDISTLLPSRVVGLNQRSYYDTSVKLYTYKGCKFISPDSMDYVLTHARAGHKLVNATVTEIVDFLVLTGDEYARWFETINIKPVVAYNYLLVAMYMFKYGYSDVEQVFSNLCDLGNPYMRIEAEGFTI